jgi:hypothetical protein
MKTSKFADLKVVRAVQQFETAATLHETASMPNKLMHWKDWYSGLRSVKRRNPGSDARKLKQLEAENERLRRLVVDLSPDAGIVHQTLVRRVR